MIHLVTGVAIDRTLDCQSVHRLCRRERRRRRRAEKGGGFCRPNQLGKIKGPARGRPKTQSARGVGAARRLAVTVPRKNELPHLTGATRVPRPTGFATVRWSLSHGFA